MDQIMSDIQAGLRALGYAHGCFSLHRYDADRFGVAVGGESVGIWDAGKGTFID